MVLTALEMQGFKSFPDKTVLRFDKGMTAVVGPNGSGKSNISDAVRWVLGEQSTKNLRGAKMEDVIFSGTSSRRALGYAEVTLRLDNKDRSLKKDSDEVSITRRYYRSGESEYKINGEAARLRDINEMFMDTGLGRDGYSIVSQGKVADMVSAKSSQRRDMLEEAAGISHFRYRRTDALRRLSQAEDNLVRLRDILAELESRVGPLKTQSEKAQKFLLLAEEKKQVEISLWLYNIDHLKSKLKEQEHKVDLASHQYNEAEAALTQIEEKIESALESSKALTLQIEEIRNSLGSQEEKAADLNSKIAVHENTIQLNNQSVERVRRDMEAAASERDEVEQTVQALRVAVEELTRQEAEKQAQQEAMKQKSEALAAENTKHGDRSAELSRQIQDLSDKQAAARIRKSSAQAGLEELTTRAADSDASEKERRSLLEELSTAKDAAQKRLTAAEDSVTALSNAIQGYELRAQTRSEKAETRRAEWESIRRETQQAEDKLRLLEDMEKNMEGYQGSVKAVVREAKRGTLRGIHGPLSQLISVPDQYTLAVETALGAAIQNVVVDSEADAKKAISFLKESKGGRATFLPISAIRSHPLQESGLDDCYGYVDLASNLVKADAKYTEIVKAQLCRTVVAEDMDSAIAMGRKYKNRFRIVTLDGQLINAGGSMTGGSRVRNAGMLSRSGETERLKAALADLQQKQAAAEQQYRQAAEEASRALAEKEATAADLITANEEKVHAESAFTLTAGQYTSVADALSDLLEEQKTNEQRSAGFRKDIAQAEQDEATLQKEIQDLSAKLQAADASAGAVLEQQNELHQQAVQLGLELLSLQKDREAKTDTISRLTENGSGQTEREAALQKELDTFLAANQTAAEEIQQYQQALEELKEAGQDARQKMDALTVEREGFQTEDSKLRSLERQKTEEKERISGELARLEERKVTMLRDYDDTVGKLFDEYQLTRREAAEVADPAEDPVATGRSLSELKGKIKALGSVNVGAIEEYKEVSERYEFMSGQITDVETSKKELTQLIDELTDNMAQQFREQFHRINRAFGTTFTDLFGGGKAELILENELDILECPIQIQVQPPGKNVQNIDLLSGGEKGLAAIALLCAILKVTPAPFCIFDEVEAALDDVNVSRFAQYVRGMTGNTQFILITHRRGTMEEADIMYGITMEEEGVSKLLELRTAEMANKLGLNA